MPPPEKYKNYIGESAVDVPGSNYTGTHVSLLAPVKMYDLAS